MRGEELEGLSLEELEELEQKLEVGLNLVSETKDEQIKNEIATLQYKGAELMEENNRLKQRVAEMNNDRNGLIVADMDRMILEEGQHLSPSPIIAPPSRLYRLQTAQIHC
nr:MADS-box protein AGL24-like [Ipomoea batatas]